MRTNPGLSWGISGSHKPFQGRDSGLCRVCAVPEQHPQLCCSVLSISGHSPTPEEESQPISAAGAHGNGNIFIYESLPCPSAPSTASPHTPAPFPFGMGSTSPFTEALCPPAESKLHFCLGSRVPYPGAHPVKIKITASCYFQICSYKFPIISTFLFATCAPSCLLIAPTGAPSRFHLVPQNCLICALFQSRDLSFAPPKIIQHCLCICCFQTRSLVFAQSSKVASQTMSYLKVVMKNY